MYRMMVLRAALALSRFSCTFGLSCTDSCSLFTCYEVQHIIHCLQNLDGRTALTRHELTKLLAAWMAFATETIICGFSLSKSNFGFLGWGVPCLACNLALRLLSASSAASRCRLASTFAISAFRLCSRSLRSNSASRCSSAIRRSRSAFRESASALAAARSAYVSAPRVEGAQLWVKISSVSSKAPRAGGAEALVLDATDWAPAGTAEDYGFFQLLA